jgi:hypothetical protein
MAGHRLKPPQLGDIRRNPLWLIAHDLDQRRGSGVMLGFP